MKNPCIQMDHGSGGEASRGLVEDIFLSRIGNEILNRMDDSAVLSEKGRRLAMTTDSYVVTPIFFPGGNIGSLSVHGTVNDLCMQGARPRFLTLGLILEEGLPLKELSEIMDGVAAAARKADIQVVAGDTKVVPRGHADRIFINTSGIGWIPDGIDVGSHNARPGDVVIINGDIGDHGMAILTRREGLRLKTPIMSDSAPLNALVAAILRAVPEIHVLRDPTRGGVATALNEIAGHSGVGIRLFEKALPISKAVRSASEILGLDPLYVANEGKCIVLAPRECADAALSLMKKIPEGKTAQIIGDVTEDRPGTVVLETAVGGTRILATLTGEPLPRIC